MSANLASSGPSLELDPEVVKALHWCRLGLIRPDDESAFHRAKAMGLLVQDPCWRTTPQGDGVLVALGRLDGKPAPDRAAIIVLWAACEHYPTPQFVAAWSDGLQDCYPEGAADRRAEAEEWFRSFGEDECWRFWTTVGHLERPAPELALSGADSDGGMDGPDGY